MVRTAPVMGAGSAAVKLVDIAESAQKVHRNSRFDIYFDIGAVCVPLGTGRGGGGGR